MYCHFLAMHMYVGLLLNFVKLAILTLHLLIRYWCYLYFQCGNWRECTWGRCLHRPEWMRWHKWQSNGATHYDQCMQNCLIIKSHSCHTIVSLCKTGQEGQGKFSQVWLVTFTIEKVDAAFDFDIISFKFSFGQDFFYRSKFLVVLLRCSAVLFWTFLCWPRKKKKKTRQNGKLLARKFCDLDGKNKEKHEGNWMEICPAGGKFCPACREINIPSRSGWFKSECAKLYEGDHQICIDDKLCS